MRQPAPALPQNRLNGHETPENETVICPGCGEHISLSEALRTKFIDRFEREYKKKEQVAAGMLKQKEELLIKRLQVEKQAYERSLQDQLGKKIQGERARIEEEIRLRMAEKEKQLADMKNQIAELKRKSEVVSQQLQGEVLELELEATLKKFCITDDISPVAKGARGGDIIQRVISNAGHHVGTIVWETKRTKAWSDGWLDKIKEDQRAISAECAVIVSDILPKGVATLGLYEGVWVCDTRTALGLATALRVYLLQVGMAKASVAGKDAKMEIMYRYLTGTQFSQSIQALVETFIEMQTSIQNEKKAYMKIWAQREQQLERAILNTAAVYGNVQGIVGAALPSIPGLELPQGKILEIK